LKKVGDLEKSVEMIPEILERLRMVFYASVIVLFIGALLSASQGILGNSTL